MNAQSSALFTRNKTIFGRGYQDIQRQFETFNWY